MPTLELVRRYVSLDHVVGVLVSGSIPLRVATPNSDIDLIVVLDSDISLGGPSVDTAVRFQGQSLGTADALTMVESIIEIDGLEIDINFTSAPRIEGVSRKLANGEGYISLTGPDCAILSRVKTGWFLHGEGSVREWCPSLFGDSSFEAHCCARYLVFAKQDIEDAITFQARGDLITATHVARLAVEKTFFSLLASTGIGFAGSKWPRLLNTQLYPNSVVGQKLREVVDDNLDLIFPRASNDLNHYISRVKSFADAARSFMAKDPILALAFRFSHQLS
jgi:hypothetical protein